MNMTTTRTGKGRELERFERYKINNFQSFEMIKKKCSTPNNYYCYLRKDDIERYTYDELMDGSIPINGLMLNFLEWHLKDDDLLERLYICRDFLFDLESGDLYDRKYRAMLTPEQYLMRRRTPS